MWCWRRLLRVPWTARKSNQSILKDINPGISLEGLMLKLKLQYFGHLMQRVDSLEKTLMRRDWGQEEKGMTEDEMAGWHHWLDERESEWTLGVGDGQGGLACCDSWDRKESDTTEQLTELNRRWQETWTLKTIRCWWRKLKMTQTDAKIYHVLLEESTLSKWLYYPRHSTDSVKSLSNCQWHFSQN